MTTSDSSAKQLLREGLPDNWQDLSIMTDPEPTYEFSQASEPDTGGENPLPFLENELTPTSQEEAWMMLEIFQDLYRQPGMGAVIQVITSNKLNLDCYAPNPEKGCFAGAAYSTPLSYYFLRLTLLEDPHNVSEKTKNMLYAQFCVDVKAYLEQELIAQKKDVPDPHQPTYPPQNLVEEICEPALEHLLPGAKIKPVQDEGKDWHL